MKYCIHCGKECLDDAIICPACGCSVQYESKNVNTNQNQTQYQNLNQNNSVPPVNYYTDKCSLMSILGFVFAFLNSVVGLILSIVAYNEAKTTGSVKSMNFAKAGIIISAIKIGLAVLVTILVSIFWVGFWAEFLSWIVAY